MDMSAGQSTLRQPLPMGWVRKLFGELQGNYGVRFLDMWRSGVVPEDGPNKGEDLGVLNAMSLWAEKLAGFRDRPDAIRRVLDNLPAHPPTLPEFVGLCRSNCPQPAFQALPSPAPSEETRQNRSAEIEQQARSVTAATPSKDWARKLRAEYQAGRHLLQAQIVMASDALGEVWGVDDHRKRFVRPRPDAMAA